MISLHRLFTCNANAPHADLSVQRFWAGKCSWIRVVSNRFHQPQKKHNEPQLPDSLFWRWLNLQHKKRCRFGFTVLTSFSKAAEKGEMVMPQAGDQVRGGADKKGIFFSREIWNLNCQSLPLLGTNISALPQKSPFEWMMIFPRSQGGICFSFLEGY